MPVLSGATRSSSAQVLTAICLAAITLPLSFSAGAVATPAIGRSLGGAPDALAWITNAFMLTFGGLLLVAGALADRCGRKRIFLAGIAVFASFSLALGAASSLWLVDFLRAGQGIGAAGALAGGGAALAQEFDGDARMRAFSLLGTTFGVGLAFGPVVTGLLIQTLGWRSIFLISFLVATMAFAIGQSSMRETVAPSTGRFDVAGAVSFTSMLTALTTAIMEAPSLGWSHPLVLALMIAFVALLAAFIIIEKRNVQSILDISLFRYRGFVGVQLLPVATCFCFVVMLVVLPFRFIGIERLSEMTAGLLMMALSAPMLIVPVMAGRLARHLPARALSSTGLILAAIGLVWLGSIPVGNDSAVLFPMMLIGAGAGLPWGLMDGLSVSVVPTERAGIATGIFGTVRVAGEGVALAIVGAMLAGLTAWALRANNGLSSQASLLGGQRLAVGDVVEAMQMLPGIRYEQLTQAYGTAFASLCWILAGLTALCGIGVYRMLPDT